MERKSSTEYSVVFLGKQKVQVTFEDFIFVVGSVLLTGFGTALDFAVICSASDLKYSRASASWFFLSTAMVFAAVRTHFPRKTPVFIVINTETCVTRVTSNRVKVHRLNSQHLAMVRTSNMAELVPSGIFCLQPWFLQRTKHIFLRKTPVFM